MPPADHLPDPDDGRETSSPDTLELVRRFSHDVVNPLMSVLALTEVMLLDPKADDRVKADLRRIHGAAEEAIGLVRDLTMSVAPRRGWNDDSMKTK